MCLQINHRVTMKGRYGYKVYSSYNGVLTGQHPVLLGGRVTEPGKIVSDWKEPEQGEYRTKGIHFFLDRKTAEYYRVLGQRIVKVYIPKAALLGLGIMVKNISLMPCLAYNKLVKQGIAKWVTISKREFERAIRSDHGKA